MAPEVSVVMSVHNDAQYLSTAILSILSQEGVSLEFIIVNDGSSDGSVEILGEWSHRDGRIKLIHQDNAGLTKALIRGCSEASGEFIARQDADDISLPGRLAGQLALLQSDPDIGFVGSSVEYVGPAGEHLDTLTRPTDPVVATELLLNRQMGPPAHGSVMFRKKTYERVGGYRAEFYFAQDSDLWLRMGEISRIAYCPQLHYSMRIRETNLSSSNRPLQEKFGVLGQLCRKARVNGQSESDYLERARVLSQSIRSMRSRQTQQRDFSHRTTYLIGSQLEALGDPRAIHYLKRTIKKKPWHVRAWAKLLRAKTLSLARFYHRQQS